MSEATWRKWSECLFSYKKLKDIQEKTHLDINHHIITIPCNTIRFHRVVVCIFLFSPSIVLLPRFFRCFPFNHCTLYLPDLLYLLTGKYAHSFAPLPPRFNLHQSDWMRIRFPGRLLLQPISYMVVSNGEREDSVLCVLGMLSNIESVPRRDKPGTAAGHE
jgi:hypothetical protein